LKVKNQKLKTVSVGCSYLIHMLFTEHFDFLVYYFSRKRYSQTCGYNGEICCWQWYELWITVAFNV